MSTVLVVEDDPVIAKPYCRVLGDAGHHVARAGTLAEARSEVELSARRGTPLDVVLLDLQLPDGDAETVIPFIRDLHPGARLGSITGVFRDSERVIGLQAMSVRSVPKPVSARGLLDFVHLLAHDEDQRVRQFGAHFHLTSTETLVVGKAARGLATKEIAAALGRAESTIKTHWQRIRRKTGLGSPREIVAAATRFAR